MIEIAEVLLERMARECRVLEHVAHVGGQEAVFTAHFAPFRKRNHTALVRRRASRRSCRAAAVTAFAIPGRSHSMDSDPQSSRAELYAGNKTTATNSPRPGSRSPPWIGRSKPGTLAHTCDSAAACLDSRAHTAAGT